MRTKKDSLFIRAENLNTLRQNKLIVLDAINYRWTLVLEDFNHSLRLSKQIRIVDEEHLQRKPLGKYSRYIKADNPD